MKKEDLYLFNNDEEFQLLIGDSNSYINLQNQVSKLVGFIRPNYLIEFGSGSGATSIRLAKENPNTSIVAVDLREKLALDSADRVSKNRIRNVTFVNADLTKLDNFNMKNCNAVVMLFSFKYIEDPIEKKLEFLTELHKKMQKDAYVIIADTFIEDGAKKQAVKKQSEEIFYNSGCDSFWKNLKGLSDEEVMHASEIKKVVMEQTDLQDERFSDRDGIYPVSREWLLNAATNVGFKIVINEKLNSLNDAIFVLKK